MIDLRESEVRLDDVQVGNSIYRRSIGNQGNVVSFDACGVDDVRMDLVETILDWFENWRGVHVLIKPYSTGEYLTVRVGWPCGQYCFVSVIGYVDPPVFRKATIMGGVDLDFTAHNFWRALTIQKGGDIDNDFGGLCPPGPRQLMERQILESDFRLTNREYSFDELRSICYELPNVVGWSEAEHDRVTSFLRRLRDELLNAQENGLSEEPKVENQPSRLRKLVEWIRGLPK